MDPEQAQSMGSNYEVIAGMAAPSMMAGKAPKQGPYARPTHGLTEPVEHTVYHGTPHSFDRFDMGKVGTGEGAQAYGHGLYFAENPGVAKSYSNAGTQGGSRGNVLQVNLPKDVAGKMLDWDKPLSEQPEMLKLAVERFGPKGQPENWTGQDFHNALAESLHPESRPGTTHGSHLDNQQAAAANFLKERGIPGIRYLDQGSRPALSVDTIKRNIAKAQTGLSEWEVAATNGGRAPTLPKVVQTPETIQQYTKMYHKHIADLQKELAAAEEASVHGTSNYVLFDDSIPEIVTPSRVAELETEKARAPQPYDAPESPRKKPSPASFLPLTGGSRKPE
jgi:hypothetical protein